MQGISHILAVSLRKTVKEQAMDELKEKRFLEDITWLIKSFNKGNIVVPLKVGERVGRIKARYPTVGKYCAIEIKTSEDRKESKGYPLIKSLRESKEQPLPDVMS